MALSVSNNRAWWIKWTQLRGRARVGEMQPQIKYAKA